MVELIGVIGVVVLLVGFVLNSTKKISEKSRKYFMFNFVGGGLLSYYAWSLNNLPFLVLELVWAGFAGYKLINLKTAG